MTDDEADEIMRAAIRDVIGQPLIGAFVMVATVYDDEGETRTSLHASVGMTLPEQMGLLMSALNRANAVDAEGWERARRDDDA